jgi:hypothetical protein
MDYNLKLELNRKIALLLEDPNTATYTEQKYMWRVGSIINVPISEKGYWKKSPYEPDNEPTPQVDFVEHPQCAISGILEICGLEELGISKLPSADSYVVTIDNITQAAGTLGEALARLYIRILEKRK